MAIKLQIRRGLKKDLPALASGEFGLCEDTGELLIGSAEGNLPVRGHGGAGDMLQDIYDTNGDGTVDRADHAANADTLAGKAPSAFATAAQGAKADAAVPSARKVNGKALSADVTLTAADVSAVSLTRKVNGKALSTDISLTAADVGALAAGGKAASAASADAVAWGNVTGKPSTYAPSSHTHDDRYYTESEMNTKLNAKANTSGTYNSLNVGYATNASAAYNKQFFIGDAYFVSYGPQNFYWRPGGELDYGVTLGPADGGWAFFMSGNGLTKLGSSSHKWKDVWAGQGVIQTSDRNEKNTIALLDEEKALAFLFALRPSTYKFNDGTSGRTHWGFIAQDVEAALKSLGMNSLDFAGLCYDEEIEYEKDEHGEYLFDEHGNSQAHKVLDEHGNPKLSYSLRYDEFIPIAIFGAQTALRRVEELTAENNRLQDALAALTARVSTLEKKLEEPS